MNCNKLSVLTTYLVERQVGVGFKSQLYHFLAVRLTGQPQQ